MYFKFGSLIDHSKIPLQQHSFLSTTAFNGGAENAGVEIAREDSRGGNCRSGKYRSENVWKTVRTENKNSHQLKITDSTHPIFKERLKLELSNLVHMEAISS